ncbi:hypothetical protein LCGC14_0926000 [marine sediment metagenome]|uniref:Uncharacterized protein n=1 Tax=marine sediment metagenome TaxID=412755 RepID=A0A0F9RW23_9ZZZZ
MTHCITDVEREQYTPRVTLLGLGLKFEALNIFGPVEKLVEIGQKVIFDSPTDKLKDALITILAGGKGLVEANKRVRTDPALQRAFGRKRCAEQSVISDTLDACTDENVTQMQAAMQTIYRTHSMGYGHDYDLDLQLLDIDLTGQPCGAKAEFASKGYFLHQRNRRGRQLGRVLATWYNEVVVDRIYDGKTVLPAVLQELVQQGADVLDLDEAKRARTILRIDSHGGSQAAVNALLDQGYQIHIKEYSSKRAQRLAKSVTAWFDDPKVAGRQIGWVEEDPTEYSRPLRRIAARSRKKNGQWGVGVILSTLPDQDVAYLAGLPLDIPLTARDVACAHIYFYDLRGGGVETSAKEDKQGLGITKRNKKRFAAQAMLTQLNALAHNLIVWFRHWLTPSWHRVLQLGIVRLIRDVFHCNGQAVIQPDDTISAIHLSPIDLHSMKLFDALQRLLIPIHVDVYLAET